MPFPRAKATLYDGGTRVPLAISWGDKIEEQQNLRPYNYLYFSLAYDRRPAEELYDLKKDPSQVINIADRFEYRETLLKYRKILDDWMAETNDPRLAGDAEFDRYPYYGRISR